MENDFYYKLDSALKEEGLCQSDIDFVHTLITDDSKDPNLKCMKSDIYRRLKERNIENKFFNACEKKGIRWTHSIDPAY